MLSNALAKVGFPATRPIHPAMLSNLTSAVTEISRTLAKNILGEQVVGMLLMSVGIGSINLLHMVRVDASD